MSADSTLTCRDSGQTFVFIAGEQDFYASRGYGASDGGGRRDREMFDVTCSSCFEKRRGSADRSGGSRYGARSRY